jgi:hypothetical protein
MPRGFHGVRVDFDGADARWFESSVVRFAKPSVFEPGAARVARV